MRLPRRHLSDPLADQGGDEGRAGEVVLVAVPEPAVVAKPASDRIGRGLGWRCVGECEQDCRTGCRGLRYVPPTGQEKQKVDEAELPKPRYFLPCFRNRLYERASTLYNGFPASMSMLVSARAAVASSPARVHGADHGQDERVVVPAGDRRNRNSPGKLAPLKVHLLKKKGT